MHFISNKEDRSINKETQYRLHDRMYSHLKGLFCLPQLKQYHYETTTLRTVHHHKTSFKSNNLLCFCLYVYDIITVSYNSHSGTLELALNQSVHYDFIMFLQDYILLQITIWASTTRQNWYLFDIYTSFEI
jgi:hypothetical protein